jgi:hypothetical protein
MLMFAPVAAVLDFVVYPSHLQIISGWLGRLIH